MLVFTRRRSRGRASIEYVATLKTSLLENAIAVNLAVQ